MDESKDDRGRVRTVVRIAVRIAPPVAARVSAGAADSTMTIVVPAQQSAIVTSSDAGPGPRATAGMVLPHAETQTVDDLGAGRRYSDMQRGTHGCMERSCSSYRARGPAVATSGSQPTRGSRRTWTSRSCRAGRGTRAPGTSRDRAERHLASQRHAAADRGDDA